VSIPPLGWSTYFISKAAGKSKFRIIHVWNIRYLFSYNNFQY
jgi:hypothetical protein